MRQIVIDAQATVTLKEGYVMMIDNNKYYSGSFNTNIPEDSAALARIYVADTETGDAVGDPLDEFIIIGKGEADNPK